MLQSCSKCIVKAEVDCFEQTINAELLNKAFYYIGMQENNYVWEQLFL